MTRSRNIVGLIGLTVALSGCATSYSLAPSGETAQLAKYSNGRATIESTKSHGSVRVGLAQAYDGRLSVSISAYNNTDQPFDFGYTNIAIRTPAAAIHLVDADQMNREIKRAAGWAAFGAAMQGASANYQAGQPTTTYGTAYASSAYGSAYGTYTATTYDPARAALAQQQANAIEAQQLQQIAANREARLSSVDMEILKRTTIEPHQAGGGIVMADKPSFPGQTPHQVTVRVDWAGDTHEFLFDVKP